MEYKYLLLLNRLWAQLPNFQMLRVFHYYMGYEIVGMSLGEAILQERPCVFVT